MGKGVWGRRRGERVCGEKHVRLGLRGERLWGEKLQGEGCRKELYVERLQRGVLGKEDAGRELSKHGLWRDRL